MLKSTHRKVAPESSVESPLPAGWTEHKAPTGHTYYYNAETKESTYTRPAPESDEPLFIDYNATAGDATVQASFNALKQFHQNNDGQQGHFTGGRGYQDRPRRGHGGDRPKSKAPIPNSEPWLLIKTKMGRRFVHNTETKQSLWKFPSDVMMAVIDMDRMEWEAEKKRKEEREAEATKINAEAAAQEAPPAPSYPDQTEDSDSYEEVEVTDDEGFDEAGSKRPRLSESSPAPAGPVEFDEDDIAYQLAQMEGDEANFNSEGEATYDQDEEEGLPLTESDSIALFRSLLDDSGISPYSVFEKVVENESLIDDPRYTSLPNMARRREAFAEWSRDRVAEIQERQKLEQTRKEDPKVEYLRFLGKYATPKLYWPEFKRKYKKEAEMKDLNLSDKDREKLYRELVAKMKLGESDKRRELLALMKSLPKGDLHRRSSLQAIELPAGLVKDVRFYLLDGDRRTDVLEGYIATLPDL